MFDGMLVGDRGYPCQRFLMTPYPDPDARPQQQYNISTAKPGSESRIPFGILKARFNCQRGLRASPQRAYQIVAACAILHKMATIRKEQVPPNHQCWWNWPHYNGLSSWQSTQRRNDSTVFQLISNKKKNSKHTWASQCFDLHEFTSSSSCSFSFFFFLFFYLFLSYSPAPDFFCRGIWWCLFPPKVETDWL